MISASLKIIINSSRIKKSGLAALYLRVIINREILKIPLKIDWYPDYWDKKNQVCKPRNKKDCNCNDLNLIIGDALAKANEILVDYRLRRKSISVAIFSKEYACNLNKDDLIVFMEQKINERVKYREISLGTKKSHTVTLNHLKAWKKKIAFADLNEKTGEQFERFLKLHTGAKSKNARWGQHRNLKTYLNLAKKERISFIHPYEFFKAKTEMGRFQPLTKAHFKKLYDYYNSPEITGTQRQVLRAFLFSCCTGMRHGDVRRVDLDWLDGEFFQFIPYKTRRFGTRVRVPATKEALDFIADDVDEIGKSPLFSGISEQKQNEILKDIASILGLRPGLCFQVGRETFATLYMENDGKLEVLASFLGHTSTKMTEKYVKIRDQRKKEESVRISSFFT
ncbi:site-specific integrase [Cyclobacterium marinum]|uniref:Integrase family protein n=1 Tax=Cyclobacterium marinum (strain ATCC 25205 / DSM 745 / LMG 13164 / NCIMB 1802) TaxID=880070 RepID=G0J1Y1_CYCMS|nr:site-specific integrase [Cyclobacterium marinum]AEL23987.1 integrase family protein [Cyclobacterium marinum DSM 745]